MTKLLDDHANLLPGLPDGGLFTVHYEATPPAGVTAETLRGDLMVYANGEAALATGIPVGYTVTLTETHLPALPGYEWNTPVFDRNSFVITEACVADGPVITPLPIVDSSPVAASTPIIVEETCDQATAAVYLTNSYPKALGGFSVTKSVTGSQAAIDTVGTTAFTVNYTVDGKASATPLTVTNGSTVSVKDLPTGAVVKLSEVAPTAAGVTFGTPTFSVGGQAVSEITIGRDTVVAVTLTNPAKLATKLPETGVDGLGFTAAGALVLVLGSAIVLGGRRRNNNA